MRSSTYNCSKNKKVYIAFSRYKPDDVGGLRENDEAGESQRQPDSFPRAS